MDLNSIPERIEALFRQQSNYKCDAYLSLEFQRAREVAYGNNHDTVHSLSTNDGCDSSNAPGKINEFWREKICEWEYQVIDHFDFNREVVAVSLSYLDRFLCTRTVSKKVFQLAAMTCLYMAIKLYEPTPLNISSFIELSRGYFMVEHIVAMEETILRELSWFVHPPTALTFVKHLFMLLDLYNIDCAPHTRHDLGELARFLCELSVCDYFFVTKKQSSIALAALQTAMDQMDLLRLPSTTRALFLEAIHRLQSFDLSCIEVSECRTRLNQMYRHGCYGGNTNDSYARRGPSPNFVGDVPDHNNSDPKFVTP